MRFVAKQVTKEDGRYLIYFHFPDSATPEQAAAFAKIAPEETGFPETQNHTSNDAAELSGVQEAAPLFRAVTSDGSGQEVSGV
jgi:hypothetical protein